MGVLTPEVLWSLRRAGPPAPSPDGAWAIVPVVTYGPDTDEGHSTLWRVDPGADPVALDLAGSVGSPRVAGDGRIVATRRLPGDDQPHLIVIDGSSVSRRTDPLIRNVRDPRWSPDGESVYFLADVAYEAPTVEETAEWADRSATSLATGKATSDRVYRFWSRWLTGGFIPHIMRLDLGDGALTDLMAGSRLLLDLMEPSGTWDVSPDGSTVAFSANVTDPPYDELRSAVFTVPTDGSSAPTPLREFGGNQRRPRFSPDGETIVWAVQHALDFYGEPWKLVAWDGSAETPVAHDLDRDVTGWEFTGPTDLAAVVEDRARFHLHRFGLDGATERIVSGGTCKSPRPAGDWIYFARESLQEPADVHRIGPSREVERLTTLNEDLLADVELGAVDEIDVETGDGARIQAYVIKPPGHDASMPAPLVVQIHGGPHHATADEWHYRWNLQTLAGAGYVVAAPNFRGSAGWGHDFAAVIHGAWGDLPGADVHATTDHLIHAGVADPDRIAIVGGSYGGYLVSWLIATSDRWAAAVCHAGVNDLMLGFAADVTHQRARSIGAFPWEDLEQVLRWSPMAHTEDIATPTLVIHGELDYRVVINQGLLLYGILQAKGVDSRLLYYPDEGHWILKRANSLQWYGEVIDWLDAYVRPGQGA